MKRKIAVIGAGISGLSAAAYAAQAGHEVHVFEKNSTPGGRARQFKTENGYTFDMGPSWYWMPGVIEKFFADFGRSPSDYYTLVQLDPQFEIIFPDGNMSVPASYNELKQLFEETEAGAGRKLDRFMRSGRYKYEVGMEKLAHKPCHSWWEFASPAIAAGALKLDLFTNFRDYVAGYFSHPKLRALMEFPVIFLGASPRKIPALYSLMNYGGYALGTWYPMGGFYRLVLAMEQLAKEQGVQFHFNHSVEKITTYHNKVSALGIDGNEWPFDSVIASSDYRHTETLLPQQYRNYKDDYWASRVFAPSCLIYYLGFNTTIPRLGHHTLFFENDLDTHIGSIYDDKRWPDAPLFYACCPSKTDPTVAPEGHENVFLLMPLATGIHDEEAVREKYLAEMIARLEKHTGVSGLLSQIAYSRSYCVSDFSSDYNAYLGNAYGLANTLSQTAVRKPAIRNRRLSNLFYAGQLTVPGPGIPPSLISGKIAATELINLQ